MTRFYATDDERSNTAVYQFEKDALSTHTPSNGGLTHSASIAGLATDILCHSYVSSEQAHNSATWPTTNTYSVSLNVSVIGADITGNVNLGRYDSSGAFRTSFGNGNFTGTGVKTLSGSGSNPGGSAATDVLGAVTKGSNSNMMSTQTIDIRYSDSDTWIEGTDLTPPGGATTVTPATLSRTVSFGSSTVIAGQGAVVTPTVLSRTVVFSAPTVSIDITATPATLSRTVSLPVPTVSDVAPFGAPTGLTATPISETQIDLAWNTVTGASGYDIERDGVIILTDHPSVSYSDTGLTSGIEYNYRVRAVKA